MHNALRRFSIVDSHSAFRIHHGLGLLAPAPANRRSPPAAASGGSTPRNLMTERSATARTSFVGAQAWSNVLIVMRRRRIRCRDDGGPLAEEGGALATVVAAFAAEFGLSVSEELVFTILGVGVALILGIAHEDAGRGLQANPAERTREP